MKRAAKKRTFKRRGFLSLMLVAVAGTGLWLASCTAQKIPVAPAAAGPTPVLTYVPLQPNSIVFTAFITNGNAQQAFAPVTTLPPYTFIYITNMAWDASGASGNSVTTESGEIGNFKVTPASGTGTTEGILAYYTGNGSVPAGKTLFSFQNNSETGCTNSLNGNGDNFSLVGSGGATQFLVDSGNVVGDKLLAFTTAQSNINTATGAVTGQVNFIAALIWGHDTWTASTSSPANYYDTCLPKDLSSAAVSNAGVTDAVDLSGLFNASGSPFDTTSTNQLAVLGVGNTCSYTTVSSAVNPANWTGFVNSKKVFGLPGEGGVAACGSGYGWNMNGYSAGGTLYSGY